MKQKAKQAKRGLTPLTARQSGTHRGRGQSPFPLGSIDARSELFGRGKGDSPLGFTLVELMFVISIIVILISILIPVVSKVKKAAQTAAVKSQIHELEASVENYHQTFRAYPGPIADDDIYNTTGTVQFISLDNSDPAMNQNFETVNPRFEVKQITAAENLVLGLCGGLRAVPGTTGSTVIVYNPSLIGQGPLSLNLSASTLKYPPFCETRDLSWRLIIAKRTGDFEDEAGDGNDSIIPEFLDRFPNPLPILYLRARVGVEAAQASNNAMVNVIRTWPLSGKTGSSSLQQYELRDIYAYTAAFPSPASQGQATYIGVGKKATEKPILPPGASTYGTGIPHGLNTVNSPLGGTSNVSSLLRSASASTSEGRKYYYPYDAYAYFEDPNNRWTAGSSRPALCRAKDRFILISAGADRIYGTSDDITTFGAVNP